MIALVTTLAAVALVVFAVAHVRLVVTAFRRRGAISLLALVLPPLAPFWGWEDGHNTTIAAWGGALVVYACVVALA